MNYIISTRMVPRNTYVIGDGITIQPVLPLERMYDYGIPHGYKSVMALTIGEDKMIPEAYNISRNLAVFHSFMADDEEVFQYAAEKGIKESYQNSELTFISNPTGIDFDRFPLAVPKLSKDEELIPRNYQEVLGLEQPYPYEDSFRSVNYRDLFKDFCGFESCLDESVVQLRGQIYSYVFIRSIWDVSNLGLLYRNINMSAMFYIAILENIIGEPLWCETDLSCPTCQRKIERHYAESWREHLMNELNGLEEGWGNKYINPIMNSRSKRHLFAHGATYSDLTQELWKICDKRYYYSESITEEDMKKEKHLSNEENNLNILERTVRKALITRFLNVCGL